METSKDDAALPQNETIQAKVETLASCVRQVRSFTGVDGVMSNKQRKFLMQMLNNLQERVSELQAAVSGPTDAKGGAQ